LRRLNFGIELLGRIMYIPYYINNILPHNNKSPYFLAIILLTIGLFCSCNQSTDNPSASVCIVSFVADGGTPIPQPQSVIKGGKVNQPTAMTKEGYVFCGWYREGTSDKPWDFINDVVTDDITLYAMWNYAIDINVGNVEEWVNISSGNPDLAEELSKRVLEELKILPVNSSEKAIFLTAGMSLASEISGLAESILSNAANLLGDLDKTDEEIIGAIFGIIQNDFNSGGGPKASDYLSQIINECLKYSNR